ncbi:MAG: transcriptional regulator NrdR [Burkholderiales bacterium]|nr:transcriptional regulator NrdR [Burkholderiales bacterium]
MKCPFCSSSDTQVVDSRNSEEGDAIRRRRQCNGCSKRFTTYERVELPFPTIVKKNGARVEYNRNKLQGSLSLALRKRPVSSEDIDASVARIEEQLINLAQREVASEKLGEWVMGELKKLDPVAYIRFASVYRSFEDVQAFADAIGDLLNPPKKSKSK